jgi:dihydroorotate dehydrogenase
MPDMTTTYLGFPLRNPLVASASPLSKKVATAQALADAGAAAIVMYSLFEEQISHDCFALDHYLEVGTHSYAESLSYFPDLGHYNLGAEEYLNHLRALKQAVDIPVIASLNGVSSGGWIEYAQRIQDAGVSRSHRGYTRAGDNSHRGEAQSLFHGVAQFHATPGHSGRARIGALQPLLPAGFRP